MSHIGYRRSRHHHNHDDDDGDDGDDDIWKLGRTRMTKPSSSLKPYSSSSLMYSSLSDPWFPFSEKCTLRVRLVM
jgi:hypothetical protein